jgi:hypothetical protein
MRIEEESGGLALRTAKKVERKIEKSQRLLEDMTQEPEKVIEALAPSERDLALDELNALADRAGAARKGSELVTLADDVIRLVTDRPALLERFPVKLRRGGDQSDIDVMYTESEVMRRAGQIDNSVVELREAIEEELRELEE